MISWKFGQLFTLTMISSLPCLRSGCCSVSLTLLRPLTAGLVSHSYTLTVVRVSEQQWNQWEECILSQVRTDGDECQPDSPIGGFVAPPHHLPHHPSSSSLVPSLSERVPVLFLRIRKSCSRCNNLRAACNLFVEQCTLKYCIK